MAGGPMLLASYWLVVDMMQLWPMSYDTSPRGLWERFSHSLKETQGSGGSLPLSGHRHWMEYMGPLKGL